MEQFAQPHKGMFKNSVTEHSQPTPGDVIHNDRWFERRNRKTSAKSYKRKYVFQSSIGGINRALRASSAEKPKAVKPNSNIVNNTRQSLKKKRKQKEKIFDDEFSRARKHLRYLLTRISYEKNLIDVYCGGGWKGQSVEKIKLEQEVQHAKAAIFRRKLKIRDLFQHVDSLCAEGRLPDSVFDAEGQIDSEDIFCAICRSDDVSANNDIILCDGVCERGFHQICLDPPLLNVPTDDDGWLCPGCDCKVDCIDLLNKSQGTNLSIHDNWEKVFPEVVRAAATGNIDNDSSGFPSDASDNNDDDDGADDDNELSSNGSDLADLKVPSNNVENLGLPSDDSEDDDYDPDAPQIDEQDNPESSNSDFSSDSEDLTAMLDDVNKVDDPSVCNKLSNGSVDRISEIVGNKNSQNDESLGISKSNPEEDDSAPVSGRRQVERLDYKKLHDEEYGNDSDSSDDEDWAEVTVRRKSKVNKNSAQLSPGKFPIPSNGVGAKDERSNMKGSKQQSKSLRKKNMGADDSSHTSPEGSSVPGSRRKSTWKKLGPNVTEKLHKQFNENQYPDRVTKEHLAKELGLQLQQVNKWFDNARWSFRHWQSMGAKKGAPDKDRTTGSLKPRGQMKGESDCRTPDKGSSVDGLGGLVDLPSPPGGGQGLSSSGFKGKLEFETLNEASSGDGLEGSVDSPSTRSSSDQSGKS